MNKPANAVCVIPHRGPLSVGQAGWQVGGVDNAVPAPVCPDAPI